MVNYGGYWLIMANIHDLIIDDNLEEAWEYKHSPETRWKSWLSLITHIIQTTSCFQTCQSVIACPQRRSIDHQQLERMICDCCGSCAGEATPGGKTKMSGRSGTCNDNLSFSHDLNRIKSQASLVKNPIWILFSEYSGTTPPPVLFQGPPNCFWHCLRLRCSCCWLRYSCWRWNRLFSSAKCGEILNHLVTTLWVVQQMEFNQPKWGFNRTWTIKRDLSNAYWS